MPVSPQQAQDIAEFVARAYQRGELRLLERLVNMLQRGLDAPDWQVQQLANIDAITREFAAEFGRFSQDAAAQLLAAVEDMYNLGATTGQLDLSEVLPRPAAISSPTRVAAIQNLAREATGVLRQSTPTILRAVADQYQEVITRTAASALTGTPRREAVQSAVNDLFGQGISGFRDSRGRKYNLSDYVQMATRTATAKAVLQGHDDTMLANGHDLTVIVPGPRPCDICDEWARRILSISGSTPAGEVRMTSTISGKPDIDVKVYGSLADARRGGWGHPNCRCGKKPFFPGLTKPPERAPYNSEEYAEQQRQRTLEKQIRAAKQKQATALDPDDKAAAGRQVAAAQARLRDHLEANPYLKRQYNREQLVTPQEDKPRVPRKPEAKIPGANEQWSTAAQSTEEYETRLRNLDLSISPDDMPEAVEITDEQRRLARDYSGPLYIAFNEAARGRSVPQNMVDALGMDPKRAVSKLNEAVKSGTFNKNVRLVRSERWDGVVKSALGIDENHPLYVSPYLSPWKRMDEAETAKFAESLMGKTLDHTGFVSTSIPAKGKKLTLNPVYSKTNDVNFNVLVPEGTHGTNLKGIATSLSEKEVLLPEGTRTQVVDAFVDPETRQLRLTVVVLP